MLTKKMGENVVGVIMADDIAGITFVERADDLAPHLPPLPAPLQGSNSTQQVHFPTFIFNFLDVLVFLPQASLLLAYCC